MSEVNSIKSIGVLGAGQMGGGIAQVIAQGAPGDSAGAVTYDVRLADANLELAEKGKARIAGVLSRLLEKGKLTADARTGILSRITPVASVSDFASCDLVIEAATENVELKTKLFRQIDDALRPGAFLATNTSSISVTKLAAATSRPALVIGMHWMNPPPLMKLIEIVRAVQTSETTFVTIKTLAECLGKTVVTSKDSPGFLVNRILIPLLTEACFALQEGVGSPEDIDTGVKLGLNHPMGPLELADLIGLDTVLAIADVLHRDLGDSKYRAPTLLRNLVAAGWVGRKAGRGFYAYDDKGQKSKGEKS